MCADAARQGALDRHEFLPAHRAAEWVTRELTAHAVGQMRGRTVLSPMHSLSRAQLVQSGRLSLQMPANTVVVDMARVISFIMMMVSERVSGKSAASRGCRAALKSGLLESAGKKGELKNGHRGTYGVGE